MLYAAARWLVDQFDADGPDPGWHADPRDKAKEVVDGLTLQIYSELLRAEREAGLAIPAHIVEAIPRHLARLTNRTYDYPHTYGRFRYQFIDHTGAKRDELIIIEFLWYPWAIDCTFRWLNRALAHAAPHEQVVSVRRTLGHLVVDLEDMARECTDLTKTGAFVAAELLYGLSFVRPP